MGRAWKMPERLFFLDKSKGEEDRAKVSEDSFSRLLQPPLLSLSLSFLPALSRNWFISPGIYSPRVLNLLKIEQLRDDGNDISWSFFFLQSIYKKKKNEKFFRYKFSSIFLNNFYNRLRFLWNRCFRYVLSIGASSISRNMRTIFEEMFRKWYTKKTYVPRDCHRSENSNNISISKIS